MNIIIHMTADNAPMSRQSDPISFSKEYSIVDEDAEAAMNDPHTAFDIPKWVIVDDMEYTTDNRSWTYR